MKKVLITGVIAAAAIGGYFAFPSAAVAPSGTKDAVASALLENLNGNEAASSSSPVEAAQNLISTIDAVGSTDLVQSIDSAHRQSWSNLPAGIYGGRAGVRLGDLDADGNSEVWSFLKTALSPEGVDEVNKIVLADKNLGETSGADRLGWGADNFWIAFYGSPSDQSAWAWQFGGHHLAMNVMVKGQEMVMSPVFLGTEPATFKEGNQDILPMAEALSRAVALMGALDDGQQEKAITATRPDEVYAGAGSDGVIPAREGIEVAALSDDQQRALEELILVWIGMLPEAQTTARMETIRSEFEQSHFAWNGAVDGATSIYFQFQSPSALIEFSTQSGIGADAGHYHSVYRNITNEYGSDLVAK